MKFYQNNWVSLLELLRNRVLAIYGVLHYTGVFMIYICEIQQTEHPTPFIRHQE